MMDDSWRDLSLVERHDFLLRTGQMSDCSFVLQQDEEKRELHAHKFPLCCASPVFSAMLLGPLASSAESIRIDDVHPLHFTLMLQYIYTENVDLCDMETALGVCRVADKYLVKPLVKLCSAFIDDFISSENVCKVLEFARYINNSTLEQSCLRIIRRTLNLVLESDSFLEVDRSILVLLLEQENLCVASECHLFQACVRWAVANQTGESSLRQVLGPEILSLIRFKSFTCEEFVLHVIPTKILTESEDRKILINLVSPGEMPLVGFSNRQPRVLGLIEKLELSQKYPTIESYSNQTKWELTFSPRNSVVCIHGVELRAAKYGGGDDFYHENLTVTMSHQEFEVAIGKFQGKVRSGATFDVYFEHPFLAQPYNYYTIHVDYSNPSYKYLCNISKHKVYIAGSTIQLKIDEHEFLHVTAIYLNEHKCVE